jgi:hypothetical protein
MNVYLSLIFFFKSRELLYVYNRAAFRHLIDTHFEEAGKLFFRGQADPRLLIRLFPELRGDLISRDEEAEVFAGLEVQVRGAQNVHDISKRCFFLFPVLSTLPCSQFRYVPVVDNLMKNYSPHIKPDIEKAKATSELNAALLERAKEMLETFLRAWRRERKRRRHASGSSRSLESVGCDGRPSPGIELKSKSNLPGRRYSAGQNNRRPRKYRRDAGVHRRFPSLLARRSHTVPFFKTTSLAIVSDISKDGQYPQSSGGLDEVKLDRIQKINKQTSL